MTLTNPQKAILHVAAELDLGLIGQIVVFDVIVDDPRSYD